MIPLIWSYYCRWLVDCLITGGSHRKCVNNLNWLHLGAGVPLCYGSGGNEGMYWILQPMPPLPQAMAMQVIDARFVDDYPIPSVSIMSWTDHEWLMDEMTDGVFTSIDCHLYRHIYMGNFKKKENGRGLCDPTLLLFEAGMMALRHTRFNLLSKLSRLGGKLKTTRTRLRCSALSLLIECQ